jgi:hypothetical protein
MALKEIFPKLGPAFAQPDVVAVAEQETEPEFSADPVAQVIADNRTGRSARDDHPYVQSLRFASQEGCGNQGCFSGHES